MAVYIDDLYKHSAGRFGRMKMSHMIADTREELDAMADKIGVARRWIQKPGRPDEHYDVAMVSRAKAVEAGAIEIAYRTCGLMVMLRRMTGSLGNPETVAIEVGQRRAIFQQQTLAAVKDSSHE